MTAHAKFGKNTTCEDVVGAFADIIPGKTVVITGISPNGLGEAMAKAIASKGPATLVLTARSIQKAESVAAEITREYPGITSVQTLQLDLSSGKAVRSSAETLGKMVDGIDVLINNAGVMALPERTLSEDGHEMHFATNFLGHFLFTNLVATKLAAAQHGARVVNVISGGYMLCPIRFQDLKWEGKPLPPDEEPNKALAEQMGLGHFGPLENYNPMLAYIHSSTALMLFSLALSERLGKDGVVAITAAPGVVVTELQRHIPGFRNPNMEYKTATQGAASFLVAALDPTLNGRGGAYIDDCQPADIVVDHAKSPVVAEKLWNVAEEMVGEKFE